MKLYTIEDLKNGVCAVKNDGTLKELQKVIKLAFPKDIETPQGSFEYYYAGSILKECFIYSDTTSMYKQSVKLFLQPKMYTIEEIKSSKIAILVESEKDADYLRSINCYGYIPESNNYNFPYATNPKEKTWCSNLFYFKKNNYTIININQIITPNMKKEQEIIGYDLVKTEYTNAVIFITGIRTDENPVKYINKYFNSKHNIDGLFIKKLKEAGVLDIWFKPVFKEQFKVGDWIYVEKAQDGSLGANKRFGVITTEIATNGLKKIENGLVVKFNSAIWNIGAIDKVKIRLATKEEILKNQQKVYTLGIDKKFEIIVKDKKAFFKEEDVTQDLLEIQEYAQESISKKYTTKTYTWDFDVIVNSVGCISYKSLLSEWLDIDLT